LTEASAAARTRGAAVEKELLANPDMLNTAAIPDLLDMSEEGVRLKRRRHEIPGLKSARATSPCCENSPAFSSIVVAAAGWGD
jgi:hypothetical protein